MQSVAITRTSQVVKTPRLLQLASMFDVPIAELSTSTWDVKIDLPSEWSVGAIVGPSGSGKTTVLNELYSEYVKKDFVWDETKSIVDSFPKTMSVKDIGQLLSSVGFSSPPSWVRPFHALSNGEQFRVTTARAIAECDGTFAIDEFTSVVDRTVAQIGSFAIAKTVRKQNKRFIAVSCHYDILDWLQPDWVYYPASGEFVVGRWPRQRPEIKLEVFRVHHSAWKLFRKHHYLDTSLNAASSCFVATWNDRPVAFVSVLHFPHPTAKNIKRGHRTVCLPDFQGVGIGNALSDYIGSAYRGLGFRFMSQTSHPSMVQSRARSKDWVMRESPTYKKSLASKTTGKTTKNWLSEARTRMVASFEYIGEPMDKATAKMLIDG